MTDGHNDIHESVTQMDGKVDYTQWSSEKLLQRVTALEEELRHQNTRYALLAQKRRTPSPVPLPKRSRSTRQFDRSKYSTRLIALKFAYLGQRYNGLEYHANNNTRYPTIEEALWKALDKAKLIFPTPNPDLKGGEPNWEGCEYSKAGRTDKGVSAFGQVIGIRVRSNRPVEKDNTVKEKTIDGDENVGQEESDSMPDGETSPPGEMAFDPTRDEIPYPQILNRLLPPEIRILAWCPSPPPDFSARFSCEERCYKYFFTQPAFTPTAGQEGVSPSTIGQNSQREGWLDIEAMRDGAKEFTGSHDFRNFCKVDPGKQIDNFRRIINASEIVEVTSSEHPVTGYLNLPGYQQHEPSQDLSANPSYNSNSNSSTPNPKLYAFKIRGSGFLWHQVRHMVGILFLIGQNLESPSLIPSLLDTTTNPEKPTYEMADPFPLALEECNFPSSDLQWIHLGDYTGNEAGVRKAGGKGDGKHGLGGAVDELWRVWHKHKIDEVLAGSLLDLTARDARDAAVGEGDGHSRSDGIDEGRPSRSDGTEGKQRHSARNPDSQKIYQGGDASRLVGKYIPVLQRPRMETVEVINAKYLKRKGLDPPVRSRNRQDPDAVE
ncbi:MAG: hypothetical protein Q9169_005455 [Polycauliona sp. 2 TL-2023]